VIAGLAAWLVNGLALLGLTVVVQRRLRLDRPSLIAVSWVVLWIFLTTGLTFAMGMVGLLRPLPLAVCGMVVLAILLAVPSTRRDLAVVPAQLRLAWSLGAAWWRSLPRWLQWLTGLIVLASTLRFAFLIWALPPFVWDSLTYHLTNVAHWVQAGRIELFETPMQRIYTPANYEVLAAWFAVFLHHDVVVEAAGLPAYLLAILAVYAGGRSLGIRRTWAWLGALAYGLTPALLLAVTGTKNDPHIAAYYLTLLAVILDLLHDVRPEASRRVAGRLLLLCVVFLLALGTKAYILHISAGLVVVAIAGAWQQRERFSWGRVARAGWREVWQERSPAPVWVAGLLIVGIVVGGYWNTRNLLLQGNPFYPYGVRVEGETVLTGRDKPYDLSLSRLSRNLEDLADRLGDKRGRIAPDLPETTGWGWYAHIIGIPTLIWALWRWPSGRLLAAGFAVSLLALFLSDRPSPYSMRYAIWFPALFAFTSAMAYQANAERTRWFRWVAIIAATVCLGLDFIAVLNYGRISPDRFEKMLDLPASERDAAKLAVNMPREYELALSIVPRDAVLGYHTHVDGFIYPLYRADFSQHLVYVPFSIDGTCGDVAEAMRQRGADFLFVAPGHTLEPDLSFIRCCADLGSAVLLRADGLYTLRPDE